MILKLYFIKQKEFKVIYKHVVLLFLTQISYLKLFSSQEDKSCQAFHMLKNVVTLGLKYRIIVLFKKGIIREKCPCKF